jgi:tetratricopeptide (TPR) repeat protein
MTDSDLLQRGIAAAQAGRRDEARQLLTQAVEHDERNEQAWLWLAGVVDDPEDMRTCLENVLDLNPANERARKGLAWVEQHHGPRRPEAAEPPRQQPTVEVFRPSATGESSRISLRQPEPEVVAEVAPPAHPAPTPAPPPPARSMVVALPGDENFESGYNEPDNPCPYCGAPTTLAQQHCLRCKKSLEIRDQPPEKRSFALSLLGGLWIFDGALVILSSLAVFGLAVLAYQAGQAAGAGRGASAGSPLLLATVGFIVLLLGAFRIGVGRALRARARWAFYVAAALSVLGLIGTLINTASGLAMRQALVAQGSPLPRQQAEAAANGLSAALLCGVIVQLIYIGLVALSYRDFFGPMRRFVPSFPHTEHTTHYNNGVAYKNRGMWYMAMREWELAIQKARRNITYLHALGLAYAQLGRFDRARAALDRALENEPANLQLQESRKLVDQMAAKAS